VLQSQSYAALAKRTHRTSKVGALARFSVWSRMGRPTQRLDACVQVARIRSRRQRRHTSASLDGLPLLPRMVCKQPRRGNAARCEQGARHQKGAQTLLPHAMGHCWRPFAPGVKCAAKGNRNVHRLLPLPTGGANGRQWCLFAPLVRCVAEATHAYGNAPNGGSKHGLGTATHLTEGTNMLP